MNRELVTREIREIERAIELKIESDTSTGPSEYSMFFNCMFVCRICVIAILLSDLIVEEEKSYCLWSIMYEYLFSNCCSRFGDIIKLD